MRKFKIFLFVAAIVQWQLRSQHRRKHKRRISLEQWQARSFRRGNGYLKQRKTALLSFGWEKPVGYCPNA